VAISANYARETISVKTPVGAHIHLIVTYTDGSTEYDGYGNTPGGSWQRNWRIKALHACTGSAHLIVTFAGRTRNYTLHFQVK
jgi:hypothetical protein